jgi:hypothetical protein
MSNTLASLHYLYKQSLQHKFIQLAGDFVHRDFLLRQPSQAPGRRLADWPLEAGKTVKPVGCIENGGEFGSVLIFAEILPANNEIEMKEQRTSEQPVRFKKNSTHINKHIPSGNF